MKAKGLVLVGVAVLCSSLCEGVLAEQPKVPQEQTVETQVRAAMQSYAKAIQALDVDAIVSYYSNVPDFRFIEGEDILTYDDLVKMVRQFIPSLRAAGGGFGAIHVTVLGPDAALAAAPYLDIFTDLDGKTTRVRGTVTWVWMRTKSRWQIIHGHAVQVPDASPPR